MELELYQALTSVNVPPAQAEAVVASIQKEIDKRYSLHSSQLFTQSDGAELRGQLMTAMAHTKTDLITAMADTRTELIKWTVGSMFTAIGLFAAITKLWH